MFYLRCLGYTCNPFDVRMIGMLRGRRAVKYAAIHKNVLINGWNSGELCNAKEWRFKQTANGIIELLALPRMFSLTVSLVSSSSANSQLLPIDSIWIPNSHVNIYKKEIAKNEWNNKSSMQKDINRDEWNDVRNWINLSIKTIFSSI